MAMLDRGRGGGKRFLPPISLAWAFQSRYRRLMSSSTHLILVFHGSRQPEAAIEAGRFRDEIASTGDWASVQLAWIQFGEPDLGAALEQRAAAGARQIVVAPMLLLPGRHLDRDLPEAIAAFQTRHPECPVRVTGLLTRLDGFVHLINDTSQRAAEQKNIP